MKLVAKLVLSGSLSEAINAGFVDDGVKPWPDIVMPDNFELKMNEYSVKTGKLEKTTTKFVYYFDSQNDRDRLQKFVGQSILGEAAMEYFYDHKTGNSITANGTSMTCKPGTT